MDISTFITSRKIRCRIFCIKVATSAIVAFAIAAIDDFVIVVGVDVWKILNIAQLEHLR